MFLIAEVQLGDDDTLKIYNGDYYDPDYYHEPIATTYCVESLSSADATLRKLGLKRFIKGWVKVGDRRYIQVLCRNQLPIHPFIMPPPTWLKLIERVAERRGV